MSGRLPLPMPVGSHEIQSPAYFYHAGSFERGAALKAALNASMDFRVGRARVPEGIPE